jgi:hypothetical protein
VLVREMTAKHFVRIEQCKEALIHITKFIRNMQRRNFCQPFLSGIFFYAVVVAWLHHVNTISPLQHCFGGGCAVGGGSKFMVEAGAANDAVGTAFFNPRGYRRRAAVVGRAEDEDVHRINMALDEF